MHNDDRPGDDRHGDDRHGDDRHGDDRLAAVTDLTAVREARADHHSTSARGNSIDASDVTSVVTPLTPPDVPSRIEALATAEQRILARLRRADRSREELRRELASDEFLDRDGIEELLDRLADLGYIDDERMAEALADKLLDRKGKGLDGVRRELRARLLDDNAIAHALNGRERDDDFARAAALAAGRAARLRGLDRDVALRRLTGFLQRRGFLSGVALIAAGEALDAVDRPAGHGTLDAPSRPATGVYFGNLDDK